eukprot:173883-Prorocentrum_lima.AAC.1
MRELLMTNLLRLTGKEPQLRRTLSRMSVSPDRITSTGLVDWQTPDAEIAPGPPRMVRMTRMGAASGSASTS